MGSEEESILYKVSYVVKDGKHPGAIVNVNHKLEVGEEVTFNGFVFEVTEVMELMPPVGDFGFLHATCVFVREAEEA